MRWSIFLGVAAVSGEPQVNVFKWGAQYYYKDALNPRAYLSWDSPNSSPDDMYYGDAEFTRSAGKETLNCYYKDDKHQKGIYGSYTYEISHDRGLDYSPRTLRETTTDIGIDSAAHFVQALTDGNQRQKVNNDNKVLHRVVRKFCNMIAHYHYELKDRPIDKGDAAEFLYGDSGL